MVRIHCKLETYLCVELKLIVLSVFRLVVALQEHGLSVQLCHNIGVQNRILDSKLRQH